MPTMEKNSATVTLDQARFIDNKAASGEYASNSKVIRNGLRALAARDRAVDTWPNEQIVPEYDRVMASDATLSSTSDIRTHLDSQVSAAAKGSPVCSTGALTQSKIAVFCSVCYRCKHVTAYCRSLARTFVGAA